MELPGRNDLCHCGSGKKYKKCCLQKDEEQAALTRSTQHDPKPVSPEIPHTENSSNIIKPGFEPEASEIEDPNITKLWEELDNYKYPADLDNGLTTIETFIQDFPDLAQQSSVIDEMFSVEEYLYKSNRYSEYIVLLEKTEKIAPEFYSAEAEWFDLPRLRYAIATGQKQLVDPLLVNLKSNSLMSVDILSEAVDLLAWSGAEDELHNLVHSTYKLVDASDQVLDSDFVTDWVYFDIYYTIAMSSQPIDESASKIVQLMKSTYELIGAEDDYDLDYIKNVVLWIRKDTFVWDCPSGNDERINFYLCMGWQFFKYLNKTIHLSKYQARFIQRQVTTFLLHYTKGGKSKKSFYFITKENIRMFCKRTDGIAAVGFLQGIFHFFNYLHYHERIDESTKNEFQAVCREQYKNDLESDLDCYPAPFLISNFPELKTNSMS